MSKRILTIIAVAGVTAALFFLIGSDKPAGTEGAPARARATSVIAAPAQRAVFERSLTVQGNVRTKNLALISPRIAGTLEQIMVDEGDAVEAGVTPLFQTDSLKLSKTVDIRRHEVEVAEYSLREKQASKEKSQADFDKAEYDWNRRQDLFERGIASRDEYEEAQAEYRRSGALLRHAQALVELAEAQLRQARTALAIAEKDLRDSLVIAPINGKVTKRYREPGEMGTPGDPVLKIEDPELLEIAVFLPARAYGEVVPGQTRMRVTANGVDLGEQTISYKSTTIDAALRTFEARCLLRGAPYEVAAGAMAQVSVILERREGVGVPRDAIQRRSGGTVVFVAENDRARMKRVKTGLENGELVEIEGEGIAAGTRIVTLGGYFLNDDETIAVQ